MKPFCERIPPPFGSSFVLTRRTEPRYEFAWHQHAEFELTLILAGTGRRFVGDSIENYGPGDFVLLGPNLPHTWASDGSGAAMQDAICAQFSPASIPDWPELNAVNRLLQRAECGLLFPGGVGEVHKQFELALEAQGLDRLLLFLQVLDRLNAVPEIPIASPGWESRKDKGRSASARESRARIDRVHGFLEENKLRDIPQKEAAELVGLSPAGFSRFFKRATGMPYSVYVQELRIGNACRLLSDTDRAITEVALNSGFRSIPHFNRVFRARRGMSPSSWRRANRGGARRRS